MVTLYFGLIKLFKGNICGYDAGYEDYKYMYIWDIKNAVSSFDSVFESAVCVKKCPNEVKYGTFDVDCKLTKYINANSTTGCNGIDPAYQYDSKTCNV